MKKMLILLVLLCSNSIFANDDVDSTKVIAIQQAQIRKMEKKLDLVYEKLNKFVSDDGMWNGKNSGLQGPTGPQGIAGPNNLMNIVISEANSCQTYCNFRGWVVSASRSHG